MEIEINTDVTPSLHPDVVTAVEHYEQNADALYPATAAFKKAYAGLSAIHGVRKALALDPTLTEEAKILETANFADKHFIPMCQEMDKARGSLLKSIQVAEEERDRVFTHHTIQSAVASEVRAHVKALPVKERADFVQMQIHNRNTTAALAILGAPGFLSGLSDDMKAALQEHYFNVVHPEQSQRIKAMKAGLELIEARSGLIFTQIEKAIGADPGKVTSLKLKRAASKQALAFGG